MMILRVLHRFNSLGRYCYTAHLVKGQPDILGILMTIEPGESTDYKAALMLIDMQKQKSEHIIVYRCTGPESLMATEMLLRYDPHFAWWVIAQLQNFDYLAMRTLSILQDGKVKLSPLCLLDHDEAAETPGLSSPLALQVNDGSYSFIYPKPFDVHLTSPQIIKLDVTLQQPAWDELEDQAVFISSETVSSALPSQPQEVFLPDNVSFDPSTVHAHLTSGVHVVNRTILAEAEMSMIYTDQQFRLLVLCSSESLVETQKELPLRVPQARTPQAESHWRFWLTGWDTSWTTLRWTYLPDLGIPDSVEPGKEGEYHWPTAYVAAIAGPTAPLHSTATIIVALAIHRQEEEKEVLSHGVCLDENGQVVQVCASPIGARPSLCCCEQMVVGTDLFEGNWRIWNWPVFQHERHEKSFSLEATCQRAFVHAEPASRRFWLIEELPEGVRVTHRDALTLAEVASEEYIPGVALVAEPLEHPLNGYHNVGLIPYQDTLLLLANDVNNGELVLYQVQ